MILISSIVKPYYRQNIGFYLLIYLFAFGFLRSPEHVQINTLVMSRTELVFLVSLFWIIHLIKTSLFVNRTLSLPSHSFLRDFIFKSRFDQLKEWLVMQFYLNLPFVSYGIFMLAIGLMNKEWLNVTVLLFVMLCLSMLPLFWLKYRFVNFNKRIEFPLTQSLNLWPKTHYLWFLRYLLTREPVLFFSTKLFSSLSIMGLALLYPTDDYDKRLIYLAGFFAGIGHFVIGKSYLKYTLEEMWFTRNIPFKTTSILFAIFLSTMVLTSFELLVIFRYFPNDLNLVVGLEAWFLVFAFQYFYLTMIYFPNAFSESFGKSIFFGTAVFLLLIMYKLPVFLLASILMIFGSFVLDYGYNRFEHNGVDA